LRCRPHRSSAVPETTVYISFLRSLFGVFFGRLLGMLSQRVQTNFILTQLTELAKASKADIFILFLSYPIDSTDSRTI